MCQTGSPFSDASVDPFLPSMSHHDFSHGQLDNYFAVTESDPTFSTANSEVLGDLDFTLEDVPVALGNSSNASVAPTPDFSSYSFHQENSSVDPTLADTLPPPYPFQLQQDYPPVQPQFTRRPLPVRSHTNKQFSRVHRPLHRRSLSHNDAERIAAATSANKNPALYRLRAPRARSTTPEDARSRVGSSKRSEIHAFGKMKSRKAMLTSAPMVGGDHLGLHGMSTAPLETPLSSGYMRVDAGCLADELSRSSDPIFKHMPLQYQLDHSSKVIEIGAMAVLSQTEESPQHRQCRSRAPSPEIELDEEKHHDKRNAMMKKLNEVEQHLKKEFGDCEQGLRGCEMVREALSRGLEGGELSEAVRYALSHKAATYKMFPD